MRPWISTPVVSRCLPVLVALGWQGFAPHGFAAEALRPAASVFLRASADSPVDWQRWEAASWEKAKAAGRPVYVLVGSALSELSRTTCRQTLANADTAALLNKNFICVLVDREEQPDVAALAQHYLREVKQQGGWPAHLWLTPELQPFEGAAYLPPTEEWGKTSFSKLAAQAAGAWQTDAAGCRARAAEAVAALGAASPAADPGRLMPEKNQARLTVAADAWRARADAANGGFGEPPKYPEPELLRFLLRQPGTNRPAALATLRALACSALRDPLDGGFFRYASDAAWTVPYPQKTLADQARLALAYLEAADIDADKEFTAAARGALDYALGRLRQADGSFAAAEDATAEDAAAYYLWTTAELAAALGSDAAAFQSNHGVQAGGNVAADDDATGQFKGENFLRSPASPTAADLAAAARLRAHRARRPAPLLVDRATAAAHGLILAALARAGQQLGDARYQAAAAQVFALLQQDFLLPAGAGLRHQAGAAQPAGPQDYAAVALGCRVHAQGAGGAEADQLATRRLAQAGEFFLPDGSGRYYASPLDLPAGIFARAPAGGDAPSAEALALLAGAEPVQARALAAQLAATVEEAGSATAAGDALLALALYPSH